MGGNQKHLTEVKMAKRHFTNYSNYCISTLSQQIWSHFQKTYYKFIIETNFMNVFCDKVVCVSLSPTRKDDNCKTYWKSRLL